MSWLRDLLRIFPPWVWIAGALAVAVVVVVMLLAYQRDRAAVDAAKARSAAIIAEGDARASSAASEAVAAAGERQAERADITRENRDDITSQPGAAAPVDPGVDAAILRSLCRRPSYHSDRRCIQLREEGAATAP